MRELIPALRISANGIAARVTSVGESVVGRGRRMTSVKRKSAAQHSTLSMNRRTAPVSIWRRIAAM
jgi:hypothetical protein